MINVFLQLSGTMYNKFVCFVVFCFVVFLFLSTLKQAERTEVCACAQRQRRERERESKKSDENMGGRKRMIKKGDELFLVSPTFCCLFFQF